MNHIIYMYYFQMANVEKIFATVNCQTGEQLMPTVEKIYSVGNLKVYIGEMYTDKKVSMEEYEFICNREDSWELEITKTTRIQLANFADKEYDR